MANSGNKEATLVLIKPDGIKKSLTGNIISRFSESKLIIIAAKMKSLSREMAESHYAALKEQKFFNELIKYIMGEFHTNRVMALVYYGENAIAKVREICGSTNPEEAEAYSIRGSYGRITTQGVFENVVHASANAQDAEREIKLWFTPEEIVEANLYPTKEIKTETSRRVWS
jgi:nucleoside-diphosphate kinase